eukprot:s2867_g10.t1
MAELSADQLASLFGDVLPVANKTREGASRHDAHPGNATSIQRQVQEDRDSGEATQVSASSAQGQRSRQGESAGQKTQRGLSAFFSRGHAAGGAAGPHDGPALSKVRGRHQRGRLDRAYMMLFKTKGEESILRTLHDLSVRWEALQAAKQTECAKRIALFKGMILELQARAKSFMEQETKLQSLIQLGWVTKQDQREPIWQPLVWSVEQQKDIPPLAQEYAGDILEFKLEVSTKGQAPMQAHEALASLTNSSLFPREQKDGWKL